LGGNTGFTDDAKYSLVTSAQRDGVELTAVILGAPSSSTRFQHSARLLDWGFKHLRVKTLATATETVGTVPLAPNPSRTVPVRFAEETSLPLFDLDGPVERDVRLVTQVPLPVFEGQPLGTVRFAQGDLSLATATVVAAAGVASAQETVGAVPVADYLDRAVIARAGETSSAVLRFDPSSPVERKIMLDQQVSAPVAQGARLGEVVYWQAGQEICRVPVVAASGIEAPGPVAKMGIWLARAFRGLVGASRMAQLEIVGS
jgi:D-alanyl-D-alanine carboxypeptidase